jgi:hypothetical protein
MTRLAAVAAVPWMGGWAALESALRACCGVRRAGSCKVSGIGCTLDWDARKVRRRSSVGGTTGLLFYPFHYCTALYRSFPSVFLIARNSTFNSLRLAV